MTLTGDTLAQIALDAGQLIMEVYASDFDVSRKDDSSPVTEADEKAEALILAALAEIAPDLPVIAEESVAAGNIPEHGDRFALVDPLDGTKEFINKRGEFTVNIGIIENGVPVMGVVYAPALNRLFVADSLYQLLIYPFANAITIILFKRKGDIDQIKLTADMERFSGGEKALQILPWNLRGFGSYFASKYFCINRYVVFVHR